MNTKYPIILVHGIMIKDVGRLRAFGRIEKALKKEGFTVYSAPTEAFGNIEYNADILQRYVDKILARHDVEKVNIIAHSKGGLDSIYMINNLGMADKVASLTAVSTPFKGSVISTRLLCRWPKFLIKMTAFLLNTFFRILGDKKPNALLATEQVSEKALRENPITLPEGVYCQSYSSTLKRGRDDLIMAIPLHMSKKEGQTETDAVIHKQSAIFGDYKGECVAGESFSHAQIIDFLTPKKKSLKIRCFYVNICKSLSTNGY